MEDRFNFRVFISDANLMFYCGTFLPPINEIGKNAKLMQSTGLHDKNGKLIYEGDVVNVIDKMEFIAQIFCNSKNNNLCILSKNKIPFTLDAFNSYEVIGNIYENPDLIGEVEE